MLVMAKLMQLLSASLLIICLFPFVIGAPSLDNEANNNNKKALLPSQLEENFNKLFGSDSLHLSTKETQRLLDESSKLVDDLPDSEVNHVPLNEEDAKLLAQLEANCRGQPCSSLCFNSMKNVIDRPKQRDHFREMYQEMYDDLYDSCVEKSINDLEKIYLNQPNLAHSVYELNKFLENLLGHEITLDIELIETEINRLSKTQVKRLIPECNNIGLVPSDIMDQMRELFTLNPDRFRDAIKPELEKYANIEFRCDVIQSKGE